METSGGLSAKGYIPVMAIGDEVIRESSVCVQRVADLAGAALRPDDAELAATLIKSCNALPKQTSSREIDALLRKCDDAVSTRAFLAGATLSVADVNLLPFLQRVEDDIPADATHLRGYMARARRRPSRRRSFRAGGGGGDSRERFYGVIRPRPPRASPRMGRCRCRTSTRDSSAPPAL